MGADFFGSMGIVRWVGLLGGIGILVVGDFWEDVAEVVECVILSDRYALERKRHDFFFLSSANEITPSMNVSLSQNLSRSKAYGSIHTSKRNEHRCASPRPLSRPSRK